MAASRSMHPLAGFAYGLCVERLSSDQSVDERGLPDAGRAEQAIRLARSKESSDLIQSEPVVLLSGRIGAEMPALLISSIRCASSSLEIRSVLLRTIWGSMWPSLAITKYRSSLGMLKSYDSLEQ